MIKVGGLKIAKALYDFVNLEALTGTGVEKEVFWAAMDTLVEEMAPKNRALLEERDEIQNKIDGWYRERKGQEYDADVHRSFLKDIGYLVSEDEDFSVQTEFVDEEIALEVRVALEHDRWSVQGTELIVLGRVARRPSSKDQPLQRSP